MKDDGKWKKLCLLLAIAFFTNFTYGQIRISGKIVNPSGLTVESVAVTVKGTKFGGLAGNNGQYNFTAQLAAGKYILVFIHFKFNGTNKTVSYYAFFKG